VDLIDTGSFVGSLLRDPGSYAQSLLDTKICLAPRGGSPETWRVFEGALAGCVVISDPLPAAWFYRGLPRWELRSWRQLPDAVDELLDHPELMKTMSEAARDWALNVVSPTAIGRWVARRLGDRPPGIGGDSIAPRSQAEEDLDHAPAGAASQPSERL
jgi:hypothetical protein